MTTKISYILSRKTNMWKSFCFILFLIVMSSWIFAQQPLTLELRKTGTVKVTKDANDKVVSINLIINRQNYNIHLDDGSKPLEAMDGQKVTIEATYSAGIMTVKRIVAKTKVDVAVAPAADPNTTLSVTANKSKEEASTTYLKEEISKQNIDIAFVKELIKSGANVNTKNNDGCSLLHFAAMWGNYDLTDYLLQHGADVNVQDANKRTALHYAILNNSAILYNQSEVVERLLKANARIFIKDRSNDTPWSLANQKNSNDQIRNLIKSVADTKGKCSKCNGTGKFTIPSKVQDCSNCGGKGWFQTQSAVQEQCSRCGGRGFYMDPGLSGSCNDCQGSGKME